MTGFPFSTSSNTINTIPGDCGKHSRNQWDVVRSRTGCPVKPSHEHSTFTDSSAHHNDPLPRTSFFIVVVCEWLEFPPSSQQYLWQCQFGRRRETPPFSCLSSPSHQRSSYTGHILQCDLTSIHLACASFSSPLRPLVLTSRALMHLRRLFN